MFENPRRGRQARNLTTNVPKILDVKSSSEQIFPKIVVGCPWLVLTLISFLYAVITTLWIIKFVDLLVLTATPQGLFWKWNDCLCFSACQTETLFGVEALITTAVSHISLFNRQQRRDNIIATDGLRRQEGFIAAALDCTVISIRVLSRKIVDLTLRKQKTR